MKLNIKPDKYILFKELQSYGVFNVEYRHAMACDELYECTMSIIDEMLDE